MGILLFSFVHAQVLKNLQQTCKSFKIL